MLATTDEVPHHDEVSYSVFGPFIAADPAKSPLQLTQPRYTYTTCGSCAGVMITMVTQRV